jgi:PhnB protein
MHAMVRIGDATIMLVDEYPEMGSLGPKSLKGSPVTLHLYVEDVDAVFSRAVEAGAKVTMPVADMFWGDRYGQLEDPFGHPS